MLFQMQSEEVAAREHGLRPFCHSSLVVGHSCLLHNMRDCSRSFPEVLTFKIAGSASISARTACGLQENPGPGLPTQGVFKHCLLACSVINNNQPGHYVVMADP